MGDFCSPLTQERDGLAGDLGREEGWMQRPPRGGHSCLGQGWAGWSTALRLPPQPQFLQCAGVV